MFFSVVNTYGYVRPQIYYECEYFTGILYNESIYNFYTDKISVKKIVEYSKEYRSRKELYKHFNPNEKSTPYNFIHKYIEPLIKIEVLAYTILKHKLSKLQKIVSRK